MVASTNSSKNNTCSSLFELQGKNLGPLNGIYSLKFYFKTFSLHYYYLFCTYEVSIMCMEHMYTFTETSCSTPQICRLLMSVEVKILLTNYDSFMFYT